jgi:alpha-1,3-rhamnosyl/mannosyltransferase
VTLRVAIAAHRLAVARPTGVDRYVIELVGALAETPDVDVGVGAAAERDAPDWVPTGVDVRHAPGPRTLVTLSWCLFHRPHVDRAFGRPDLVHVAVPAYPFPARAPTVYCFHDVFPLRHPEWFSRKERFGYHRSVDAALAAPAVIASSTATARDLVEVGADPARVVLVPHGVSGAFFRAATPEETSPPRGHTYDLFVGAVNPRKRVDVLVRAIAASRNPRPLVLAGPPGDGVDELVALARRLGVHDLVRPVGYVPDEDLPGLMANARALVHPSRDEGFGFTPLEAMAAGTPAVVAGSGSLAEVVGDAAVVIDDPDDPSRWAEALDRLDDPAERSTAGERGRARAARYTWRATVEQTVAVWERVLDARAG